MMLHGKATRLTVLIKEDERWHHRPLYTEIVHRAHQAGLAGASVFRGIEGYGASSVLHTTRLLELSSDLPIVIEIVDREDRIDAIVPVLDEMVGDGLMTVERVHVVDYRGSPKDGRPAR